MTHKLAFWSRVEDIRLLSYDSSSPDVKIGEMKSVTIGRRFIDLEGDENHRTISEQLRSFKNCNPGFPIYQIMNINPDGTMERTITNMFGKTL